MLDSRTAVATAVAAALGRLGVGDDISPAIERCARPEFGDWSTPAPLRAARVLRRAPLAIATDLVRELESGSSPVVREWTVSAPGYVNARLDDRVWAPAVIEHALALGGGVPLTELERPTGRTLIEHTNINTNKAAHVGHLRNACLGDTLARLLRRTGHDVEVNNYIDDTGVQVADVVVGIRELGIEPSPDEPFDQFCSRVYVEMSRRYEAAPALVERRNATLRAIEARDAEVAGYVKELATRVVTAHLATMRRFDIRYDLLTWESDIIELGFWQRAFELLRDGGHIVQPTSGPTAGCWVLPGDAEGDEKVLVKSDGVATYTAKDIAYQLWKFGLLGLDFGYRPWDPYDPDSPLTTTSNASDRAADATGPAADGAGTTPGQPAAGFGNATRVINVIDARQSYVQAVVRNALERLGHTEQAANSVHLAYEVVALSPPAARELGIDVESGRSHVALSGRAGIEVRADDLLDRSIERVAEKASDPATARRVAAGAVRYYLLKFSTNQIIAFDFDEALRTTGDTGVYLQYAHARAAGILRKVAADDGELTVPAALEPVERALLARLDDHRHALLEAAASLAPVALSAHTFALASALSDFYEHTPAIVREEDPEVRRFRRALVAATRATLADALATLGISAPDRI